jgi:hypothetical protein
MLVLPQLRLLGCGAEDSEARIFRAAGTWHDVSPEPIKDREV